ncbi:PREDICTED: uncharacterized protein LOC109582676 [Amphimedon queenslandica]|uniref:Helicase C-terminal domain-containing protein n=1 Tax=Amphimedon queenslandica TaxID=400682 RepID=A0AAN0J7T5_AMPQE|nr:PREDICTED: uncharacterized protein LOC109582676 [Amphimedon queenslandica]|eukprot:XP_019853095.1 PREDICTED: uncharacterized protein LOC109582676 [Amphimedon queenslandica]
MRIDECYTLTHSKAVARGIIRNNEFIEVPNDRTVNRNKSLRAKDSENLGMVDDVASVRKNDEDTKSNEDVAREIVHFLEQHDKDDPTVKHQAMVLTQTIDAGGTNSAEDFCECYNAVVPKDYRCEKYVGGKKINNSILSDFGEGKIRTLVVIDKLREGYDNKAVSVVAIVRNVAIESRVLFAQFVGRAIRKIRPDDPVTAIIIAHKRHDQRPNYDQFDHVTDVIVPADEEN